MFPALAVAVLALRGAMPQSLLLSSVFFAAGAFALDSAPLDPLSASMIQAEHLAMLRGHTSEVTALAIVPLDIPDAAILASGTTDGSVTLWQVGSFDGRVMAEVRQGGGDAVNALAAVTIDDDAVLAAGTDAGAVFFWSLTGASSSNVVVGSPSTRDSHSSRVSALCSVLSETHGPAVASGGFDGVVTWWAIEQPSGGPVQAEEDGTEVYRSSWPVAALEWVDSWALLAVAGDYDEVVMLSRSNAGNWTESARLQEHTRLVRAIAFAPSAGIFATLGQAQGLVAWWRPSGSLSVEPVGTASDAGLGSTARGAAWLHGPEALATGSENGVLLWTLGPSTGPQQIIDVAMPAPVTALAWANAPQELLVVALSGSAELALVKFISVRCPDGSQASSDFSSCEQCPAGSMGQLGICELCPAGTSQPYFGGTRCEPCAAGRFQASAGSLNCPACGAEASQPTAGASACQPCAGGTTASVDRLSCSACPPSQFGSAGLCEPCPNGQFQPLQGQSSCDGPCADGQASDGVTCTPCAPGTAGTGGVCLPCPWWQLATLRGQTECAEFCPPGEFADAPRQGCLGFTAGAYITYECDDCESDGTNWTLTIVILMLVVLGLVLGCVLAWFFCCRQKK